MSQTPPKPDAATKAQGTGPKPSGAAAPLKPVAPGPKPAPKPAVAKPAPPQQPPARPQQPAPGPRPAGPPPAQVATPVAPVAGPSRQRGRHIWLVLSFLILVAAPSTGAGIYLWTFAVDQYASKVGFSVRREDTSSPFDLLGGLSSLSGSSSNDTDILFEFIQSQRLVSDIDEELDLREMWSRPEEDVIFALTKESSIEELVRYWNRMVRISYGAGSGLIEVEVLAFTAEDAIAVSQTLLDRSSDMINELSDIARQDSIGYARDELNTALERLSDARATVTRFRNENQVVDPELDLRSQAGLLAMLQTSQAEALIELDVLSTSISRDTDPRLDQAKLRLRVIEERIAAERQNLGFGTQTDDGTAFADLIGEYERLVVDREFSEQAYVSALATFDAAVAESRRKTRYLAPYMQPTFAQTPQYPKRLTLMVIFTMFVFLIWSILVLVAYSVKDRR